MSLIRYWCKSILNETRHEISNNVVCATSKASDQPAHTLEYSMNVKLLTEHHLEFLSLKGDCKGWSESTLVKVPHCLKPHVTAQMFITTIQQVLKQPSLYIFKCEEMLS